MLKELEEYIKEKEEIEVLKRIADYIKKENDMEDKIKEAIDLLRKNDYVVVKMTDRMNECADKCAELGYGDCMDCPCFICAGGNE